VANALVGKKKVNVEHIDGTPEFTETGCQVMNMKYLGFKSPDGHHFSPTLSH